MTRNELVSILFSADQSENPEVLLQVEGGDTVEVTHVKFTGESAIIGGSIND